MDLSHLNPPQREAVSHVSGPMLVLAGAGSGKTRVITHRIAYLMEGGIPAKQIAALTFTNKAAEEMRERVAVLVKNRKLASELTMGTFHSLGLTILKREREALGFPGGFVIYDTSDQLGVVREILRRIRVGDRRFDVKAILTRISLAKNAFVAPDDYQPSESDEYDEITSLVYPRYEKALQSFAAVDFDDLITRPVRLFKEHPQVAERWRKRFSQVLVDEFQDTNKSQLMLVKHLVSEHHNLCVVGDDDQSIYSWRGADPTNILHFDRMYDGCRVVKLEQNYRSTPNILAAANAVIKNNNDRHGKELWSDKTPGTPIEVVVTDDPEIEARFVAREIANAVAAGERRYRDYAVLYRSNLQAPLIEEELRTAHVPYVMFGGQQFFERKEVKDVIAYLRAALNPRDEISLRRIINYPARGIGPTTLDKLTHYARDKKTTLWRAILKPSEVELRGPAWGAVMEFQELMRNLKGGLESGDVMNALETLLEVTDLYQDVRNASPSLTAAQRRLDNVEQFKRSLARQQQKTPGRDQLVEYLRQLSLANDDDKPAEGGDKVVLTTLHGAKGLEFPVVYLIGAEEELLPHRRTLMPQATDVLDPDHITDVSEERRLAYVGITRAQEKLVLSRAKYRRSRGKPLPRTPSRFLMEIPDELREERDLGGQAEEAPPTEDVRAFFQSFLD